MQREKTRVRLSSRTIGVLPTAVLNKYDEHPFYVLEEPLLPAMDGFGIVRRMSGARNPLFVIPICIGHGAGITGTAALGN